MKRILKTVQKIQGSIPVVVSGARTVIVSGTKDPSIAEKALMRYGARDFLFFFLTLDF